MKIIIGADFVPTESNKELFIGGKIEDLFGSGLLQILRDADYRIFNLEVPLTDKKTPIKKCGPALIAETDTVKCYKKVKVDLVTIANNHIMDQGKQGLNSTLTVLKREGIGYVGAAETFEGAKKTYVFDCNGSKIGVYACAEHEFSIVKEGMAGANPFDTLESFDAVNQLKSKCDYVIVLYHGGKELYRYPSPNLQKYCRKFVEKGADLVICQHSHCIGCKEAYKNGMIVYGQGNFLFDHSKHECWQTGLLVKINDNFEISFVPIVKRDNRVRLADKNEASTILGEFDKRSDQISDAGFVADQYHQFSLSMLEVYLSKTLGKLRSNLIFKVVNKLLGKQLVKKMYDENSLLSILNAIECEAHQELFVDGLKECIYGRNKS